MTIETAELGLRERKRLAPVVGAHHRARGRGQVGGEHLHRLRVLVDHEDGDRLARGRAETERGERRLELDATDRLAQHRRRIRASGHHAV